RTRRAMDHRAEHPRHGRPAAVRGVRLRRLHVRVQLIGSSMPRLRIEDAIHDAFVELTTLGEQYLSDFADRLSPGLRPGAGPPLLRLHRTGPERVSELAVQLGLDPTTVTRHLDELESRGLIVRRPDPTDRRATLVHLTPAAVAKLDAADADRRVR